MAANRGRLLSCFACFSGNTHSAQSDLPEIDPRPTSLSGIPASRASPLPDHILGSPRVVRLNTAGDKVFEIGSSSTPSAPGLAKELEYAKMTREAAEALDKENVKVDLDELINYISRLFDFIEEKEQGNNPSMPKTATDYWSGSKTLLELRKVLSEGINVFKDDCPDAKTIAQDFLRGMGSAHMATTGLLAVANILERYEQISDNKKACLSLLKEMSKLAGHVKELQKLHALKKGMEASMRETIVLIVEASMACCTQIDSTKFSGFFSTIVDGVMLAEFQKQLTETETLMQKETETLMQREYINQINMRRQKRGQLLYPQYPEDSVGIEDSLKEVIERLEMGSDKNAVAVILHGFGGMGKTTLADAVFARLLNARIEGYKYSYVRLFDDITSVPDVVKLQRCILTDLMMREESEIPEIRRYEEGQRVIEQMLEKEAAFIYIDNVLLPDRVEQGRDALRQLLPRNMGKARKLRLLLTARDKDAVRISGVKPEFYPIKSLPQEEALDLFKKTLDDDSEKQLDRSQLNQVVKICGGVPNLLKVVAGFISSEGNAQEAYNTVLAENKINWKGEIGKDMECYIFAYENLEETLKDIFLDLCFFFQGWDWEALANIVGEAELNMLEKRALLTKHVKSMTARVHDVILAIGLDKKGERFRFTRASEFQKFLDLKEDKDLEKIKGIWSSDDSHLPDIPASKLDLMHRSLRVVILGNSTVVEGKCKEIFEELVIFRARVSDLPFDVSKLKEFKKLSHLCCKSEDLENLSQMPWKIRHIDFELKSTAFQISSSCIQQLSNLRVLRLRDAQLKILPQEQGEPGNDLQELVLPNCEYPELFRVPISTLGSLKVLRIDCCSGLTQLPEDFGSLSSLQELHLRECGSLEALPSSLGNLTSLQELHLNWCVSLEALPDSVEELSSLRLLDLSYCESITNLPYGLEKLTSLVELSLRFCWELNCIPKSIGQFKLLDSLDLSHTKVNELPDEFCHLSFITKLEMNGCRYLEKLPDRFGEVTSLRKLSLVDCNSLKELPESFSHLNYLEHLNLSKCETLEELCIYFKGLSSLRVLSLGDCKMLKNLPEDFHCLASLEVLDVRNCYKLEGKWIDSMVKMKTLQIVNITGSTLLEGRWGEIQRQGDQSTLTVYTGQEASENDKENMKNSVLSELDRLLTNGRGDPVHLSHLLPNTSTLLVFDYDDGKDKFSWPLIEETVDDGMQMQIIYIGPHFDHLPYKVKDIIFKANMSTDRTLDICGKVAMTIDYRYSWYVQMDTKTVGDGNSDNYGPSSCWRYLTKGELEEFVVCNCKRYLRLKQLVETNEESNIELLIELFASDGDETTAVFQKNESSHAETNQESNKELLIELFAPDGDETTAVFQKNESSQKDRTENSERKTTTCGVDKLKGKTILVEMWPYNSWRLEIKYHQFWKEVYFMEKEKVDLEIISIPMMHPSEECDVIEEYKQFSRGVPWLVLQNSWTVITRAVKFFFEKHGGWEERDEREKWYPTINWIIEPNGRISVYKPSIFLKEEWEQPSTLEFLFNHTLLESVSVQVQKLMLPGKLICLYRGGDDGREVLYSIWNALDQQQRDRIHIIHLGRRKMESFQFTMNSKKDYYYPLKNTDEIEGMSSLNLSENEILRFSLRLCHLEKEINRMEDSELKFLLHSFQPLHCFQDSLGKMYGSIAFMDGGGKVVAALGGKILESIFDRKDRAERFIKLIMNDIEGGGGGGKEMHDEDPGVSHSLIQNLQTSSAAAVEQQNMDAYFDSLREYTSERWEVEVYQASRFNKEGEKLSLPRVTWPTSKGFCRLKNFLSDGINDDWVKDVIFRHPEEKYKRTIVIHSLLKGIEEALWAVAGLLVVADLLERLETISANRIDYLVVLEKMFRVAQYIQQFNQKPGLSWRRVKRVATAIILACSVGCFSQIDESKFALFGKENLTDTEWELRRICNMMAREAITEGPSNESVSLLKEMCDGFDGFGFFLESGDEGGPSCVR